jgi:hypothetical protein
MRKKSFGGSDSSKSSGVYYLSKVFALLAYVSLAENSTPLNAMENLAKCTLLNAKANFGSAEWLQMPS